MSTPSLPASAVPATALPTSFLRWATRAWFVVAAIGQAAFIGFILAYYGVRTASGNFAGWNDKPLITGYVKGDHTGNAVFALHVLLASVVTLGGLMQMIPGLRARWPRLHRWTGRIFMTVALFMALSGVWLSVVRGTYLSVISAVAILINGLLILAFVGLAWRDAVKRRFARHRLWALRAFMAVSGVWFLRVGIMGWIIVNRGPVGMNKTMSGPADIVLTFGCYLIPLAVLELHGAAERSDNGGLKILAATVVTAATLFMAAGVFGAIAFMWAPYL